MYLLLIGAHRESMDLVFAKAQEPTGVLDDFAVHEGLMSHFTPHFPILSQSDEWEIMKSKGEKMKDGYGDLFVAVRSYLMLVGEDNKSKEAAEEFMTAVLQAEDDPTKYDTLCVLFGKEVQNRENKVTKNKAMEAAYERLAKQVAGGIVKNDGIPRAKRSTMQYEDASQTIHIG